MSRSKKAPYWIDQTGKCNKKTANRKIRRFKVFLLQNSSYKKVFETWDICDYKFHCPDDPKAYRK